MFTCLLIARSQSIHNCTIDANPAMFTYLLIARPQSIHNCTIDANPAIIIFNEAPDKKSQGN